MHVQYMRLLYEARHIDLDLKICSGIGAKQSDLVNNEKKARNKSIRGDDSTI